MKPREFDDLIRQKFDQNDFAYNPLSWDQLAEQMDGRAKKRSIIMWWLMPLAGVAASVALAMGISPIMKQDIKGAGGEIAHHTTKARTTVHASNRPAVAQAAVPEVSAAMTNKAVVKHSKSRKAGTEVEQREEEFVIKYENAVRETRKTTVAKNEEKENKKKQISLVKAEEVAADVPGAKRAPRTSIILLGGVNQGSFSKGYTAGATIRHMLNSKVFIEGDIAFTGSNQTVSDGAKDVRVDYYQHGTKIGSAGGGNSDLSSPVSRTTKSTVEDEIIKVPVYTDNPKMVNFNQYYAQVTPSIGCKIGKKLCVGGGLDMQQALADNRPAEGENSRGVQHLPMFDMGLMGKTECAVTKQIKAGVSYRKGINNALTPGNKFIDRDDLQVQVKYTIFNK